MQQDTKNTMEAVPGSGEQLILTSDERRLIANFRKLKAAAKTMLLDLSFIYLRTLPADRPRVQLVRTRDGE